MDRFFRSVLRAASDGDDDAWTQILERYGQMMLLAVEQAGMSPALRQRIDPEDVMQRALMRAHRELPKALPLDQEAFTTWLLQVTVRSLEDRVRFHNRERRSVRGEARGLENYDLQDAGESPPDSAARVEARIRLLRAIARLDCQDQRVVLWKIMEGQSFAAIAKALGTSEQRARTRLATILNQLRTTLGGE